MPSDERIWTVEPDETGEVHPDALMEAFVECAGMARRLGGAFKIATHRRPHDVETANGIETLYLTERVVFIWSLHLPLPKRSKPRQQRDQLAADMEEHRHFEEAGELADEELIEHDESPQPVAAE